MGVEGNGSIGHIVKLDYNQIIGVDDPN